MNKEKSIYFTALAVILTYILANHTSYTDVLWSVATAYVCFKNNFYQTISKSFFRLVGTFLGGLLSIFFILNFNFGTITLSIVSLILGTMAIYFNNITTHGYGWIFLTVTFFSLAKSFLFNPNMDIYSYFWTKFFSVALGIFVSCTLRYLIDVFIFKEKKISKKPILDFSSFFKSYFSPFNINIFLYSLEAGLALFLVSYFDFKDNKNFIFYTVLSILFLSNIPYDQIISSKRILFFKKFFIRMSGTLLGAVIGIFLLYFIKLNQNLYFPILGISILIAEYFQLNKSTEYFGLQIGLLFLVILVPMPDEYLSLKKAFFRVNGLLLASLGIFASMIIVNILKISLYSLYKRYYKS